MYFTTIHCPQHLLNDSKNKTQMQFIEKEYLFLQYEILSGIRYLSRSQYPRGLRRGSVAARLLGLRVRIPPGPWMFSLVSVVCCQVEFYATG
jgi:hypothetical protein